MPRTGTDASWHEFRQLASPQINVSRDDGEYGNPYVTTRAGPDAALTAPHGLIRLLRLSSVDLASTPGDQSTTGSSVLLMPSTPVGVSAGRVACFASFRVVKSGISAVHAVLCAWFDSRQLHNKNSRSEGTNPDQSPLSPHLSPQSGGVCEDGRRCRGVFGLVARGPVGTNESS